MTATKARLHQLVDELPDHEVFAAQRFLEFLASHPAAASILNTYPEDDEELNAEDRAALAEGLADLDAGRVVP